MGNGTVDPVAVGRLAGQVEMLIPQLERTINNQENMEKEMKEMKTCLTKSCDKKRETLFKAIGKNQGDIMNISRRQARCEAQVDSHIKNHNMPRTADLSFKDRAVLHKNELTLGGIISALIVALFKFLEIQGVL